MGSYPCEDKEGAVWGGQKPQILWVLGPWGQGVRVSPAWDTHKHFQVAGAHQAVAPVVPRPAHDQHGGEALGEGAGGVRLG